MTERFKNYRGSYRGISLLEVMLAITLSLGIIALAIQITRSFFLTETFLKQKLQGQEDIRLAFQSFESEIRSAMPAVTGAYPLELASSTSIIFYSDIDSDGSIERVRYVITPDSLDKGVIKPSGNPPVYSTTTEKISRLVFNVIGASSTFNYYDSDYTGSQPPLSPPFDIQTVRAVKLILTVNTATSTTPLPLTFNRVINLRKLKSN
jgi:hypothetical protein